MAEVSRYLGLQRLIEAERIMAQHTLAKHEGHKHQHCVDCRNGIARLDNAVNQLTEEEAKAVIRAYQRKDTKQAS